jgi:hypothetical protein
MPPAAESAADPAASSSALVAEVGALPRLLQLQLLAHSGRTRWLWRWCGAWGATAMYVASLAAADASWRPRL